MRIKQKDGELNEEMKKHERERERGAGKQNGRLEELLSENGK